MARYVGDCEQPCAACGEPVEFAVGLREADDLAALHFGPGGPTPVAVEEVQLKAMIDDDLDVRFRFRCPLCEAWSAGRATLRRAPQPQ